MKKPLERKLENEKFLIEKGISINENLPMIEGEEETEIRKTSEIIKRILILSYLNMLIEGVERDEIIEFLKESKLWENCSPKEIKILERGEITEEERVNISWQSEAMWVMLWSINKIEELELPTKQCEVKQIVECLPEYLEPFEEYIETSKIRSKSRLNARTSC